RPVSARISPAPILKVSLLLMGLAVMGILLPDQSVLLYAVLPLVSLGQGFSSPNLLSLISNKADSSMQGEILGINQSVNSFAQLLPPLIGGFIVAMDIRAPLLVSGSFIVLAWLTFVTNRSYRS
ncbi:MAG: MFS transporter, partial [Cytophagia bacterium]|nr:MFS transporter [Cytophagia bacterium]